MYFTDKDHEINFVHVLSKWPQAETNKEYRAACYILALPMIFDKVQPFLLTFDTPADWYFNWREVDEEHKPYDLTHSMQQLGQLAVHLWNSDHELHLLDCLATLDQPHYYAAMCAIQLRMRGVGVGVTEG